MKKYILFLMILCLVLVFAACGAQDSTPAEDNEEPPGDEASESIDKSDWPVTYTFATAGSSDAWYAVGGAIAALSEDYLGVRGVPQASGGSAENARLVGSGTNDFGFVSSETLIGAYEGTGAFEGEKYEDLRAVYTFFTLDFSVITLPDSGITSFADLVGKKVGVGPAGSGTQVMGQLITEALGYSFDDFTAMQLGFNDMREALMDGSVDAIFWAGTNPGAGLMEVDSKTGMYFMPLAEDEITMLLDKFPQLVDTTIPAGTYESIKEDYHTVGGATVMVTTADAPESFIYELTKAIDEHATEYTANHATMEQVTTDGALLGIPIPMHPGAYRYFQEINHPDLSSVFTN